MAEKTEGFSGADLTELCQRAAKAAIRDAIAAEDFANSSENAMQQEAPAEIERKHFEEAFAGARRSVALNDLAKYDQFRKKFDPAYRSSTSGGGLTVQWPDEEMLSIHGEDDDDLYA
eukprot:TRINITY_DN72035_c0_g1_i1.p1 TRINITY_DN72035_c0_g1~~TRINITY_DN72035_c0_g1_i1.p1  ORF type:complete len:117 (-),score=27.52 TRINITY_DN72035_c0_g1_i1:353-703(-)